MANNFPFVNSKTVINTSTSFTSATTLSYTGVSYTIPANTFYAIMFNAVFIGSSPQEILLSKSNSGTSPYLVLAHSNGGAMASIAGTTDESITVYVWARYGGVGQNRIDIDGIVKSL